MGWKFVGEDYDSDRRFKTDDGEIICVRADTETVPSKGSWFNPSRDIAVSMMALCTVRKQHGYEDFIIGNWCNSEEYFCDLLGIVDEEPSKIRGKTIAHAICLAILLAVHRIKEKQS